MIHKVSVAEPEPVLFCWSRCEGPAPPYIKQKKILNDSVFSPFISTLIKCLLKKLLVILKKK